MNRVLIKVAHGAASFAIVWSLSITSAASAELALSDVPLFIKDGVDPNILVTLDDSGSMAWAYVPDAISGTSATRRFKSAYFNGAYYNPDVAYTPPKNEAGVAYTTTFTAAYEHGFLTAKGSRNLSTSYRVTTSFDPSTTTISLANNPTQEFGTSGTVAVNKTTSGVAAYYYNFRGRDTDTKPVGCNAGDTLATRKNDDDCYVYVAVAAAEQQNFANWYSFYRTRVLATASAASLAFQSLSDNVRVAYQNLNRCNGFSGSCRDHRNSSSYVTENRTRSFTGSHRTGFYRWLQYSPASGGTPLRSAFVRAGTESRRTDINSPYAKDPGVQSEPMYACRPTYHMAFTDGVWNSDTISAYGNYDNTTRTTPGGCSDNSESGTCPGYERKYAPKTYSASNPFRDGSSNAVADIAFEQWITDAQSGIPNQVPVYVQAQDSVENTEFWNPLNDPAEWQHLTTFTIAYGLTPLMTAPNPTYNGTTFGGDYSAIAAGTKSWPGVGSDDVDNPYDLWHAAINGRGQFFSADDPNALVESFQQVLGGISERTASAASVALDSGVVNGLSFAYHANFSSERWSGDVKAFALDRVCATNYCYIDVADSPTWTASTLMDSLSPGSRNIKIAQSGSLVDFSLANLSASVQASLNLNASGTSDGRASDRVNYLRGERSTETQDATGFRTRSSRLGDVIHSSPTYVGGPQRIGMDTLEGLTEGASNSYETYKSNNADRTPLVFVGANDGMLHAFNADSGRETFAFIPTAVQENLRYLTYQSYSHKFFVDGPTATGDIFDSASNSWKTILIGTLRKGGKSIFALDVTDTDNIRLLWEFSDVNLGNVYGKPTITRLHNGKWGVIVSNGYNSTNHRAVLYILNPMTGAIIKQFDTGVGALATPNGLATPTPVDINGDLITDYVYAGDLRGNMWRFDLIDPADPGGTLKGTAATTRNNVNESKWAIGFSGNPLFVAQDGAANLQPITAGVAVAPHITGRGVIVSFGTGKYLESNDAQKDTSRSQSAYGVWDRYVLHSVSTRDSISRSNMIEQTMSVSSVESYQQVDDEGNETDEVEQTIRTVSNNPMEWFNTENESSTPETFGWYLDFEENGTRQGEMLVTEPSIVGKAVIFATTTPNDDPCEAGIDRWVYGLDVNSGGRTTESVFDHNRDHRITDLDKDASGTVNNVVQVEGYGAGTSVGDTLTLNLDNSVVTIKMGLDGNNQRRSWRMIR